jgi:hypothetical protein
MGRSDRGLLQLQRQFAKSFTFVALRSTSLREPVVLPRGCRIAAFDHNEGGKLRLVASI